VELTPNQLVGYNLLVVSALLDLCLLFVVLRRGGGVPAR
jgi:hypothetical protein